MESGLTSTEYHERADMHEALADATGDSAARSMHRAMAAEYRRRANGVNIISSGRGSEPVSKLEVPMPVA